MPLAPNMINCAARIIGEVRGERRAIGTCFFIRVRVDQGDGGSYRQPYLLTAHHVIAGQDDLEVQIPHPWNGQLADPVPLHRGGWHQPLDGVDLAVAPLTPDEAHGAITVRFEDQIVADEPRLLFPGTTVRYIGLLAPDDRIMVRSGTIGALDQEGLRFRQGYSYPAHLVDCRSYGGFSGSPCFAEVSFASSMEADELPQTPPEEFGELRQVVSMVELCGMFTSHRSDQNEDGTASRYGVGVLVRSEEIRKALMTDELKSQREKAAAKQKADDERASEFEPARVEDDEFERFEEVSERLVQVPKEELDKKRAAEKKKR